MHDLVVYLLAMVLVVPLSKYAGLGSVIGYLIAGVLIGPHGFSLLTQGSKGTSELAEFGVTMMMLLIGLEVSPKVLWKLRGPIFGLGAAQMLGTIGLFFACSLLFQPSLAVALTIGMVISVSSTAISLQTLQELGYRKSTSGERTFSVLLFQDIAVIPILAALPLLKNQAASEFSPWRKSILIISSVIAVAAAGRLCIRPLFRIIARTKLRETFTALALLIVLAAAELMKHAGLSPSLGAFLAGVILADSEFRHQIEADLEPFKALLLGLFFITIGSHTQISLLADKPLAITQWVIGITLAKAVLCYGVGRLSKMKAPESLLFAISLASGGEFAFVILTQANGILSPELTQTLTISIALTMAIAPLLIKLTVQKGLSRLDCIKSNERPPDVVDESEKDNPVLVIGIGRFGQTFVRFLKAGGYPCTVLDIDSEQIDITARFGMKSYFGDGSNMDLLRAAGLDRARALVIAIDEAESALKIVEQVKHYRPDLPLFSRAFDRIHAFKLIQLGANEIVIETSGSALKLGVEVLKSLGVAPIQAEAKAQSFYLHNQNTIRDLSKRFLEDDRDTFIQASRQASEQIETMLKADQVM